MATNRSFGNMINEMPISKGDKMPYQSVKQSRWMHSQKPALAKKWDKEMPKSKWSKLPTKKEK